MSYKKAIKHWKNHRKDMYYQQCSGYSSFKEKQTEIKESVNALKVLDEIEQLRRKHENDKQQNNDWVLRVACAIIAKEAGYQSRMQWCEALAKERNHKIERI